MKLLMSFTSPFVRKVRIVTRETGLAERIEELPVTVSPVERNADVSARNPLGKIPVLVLDDGSALFDSPVICEYLDGLHDGRKLVPAGGARWVALRQQALADGAMDAAVLMRYEAATRPEPLRWGEWLEGQRAKVVNAIDELEHEAPALASELTIGTISVACALGYLDFRQPQIAWRSGRPRLAGWFENVSQRDSLKATVPQ